MSPSPTPKPKRSIVTMKRTARTNATRFNLCLGGLLLLVVVLNVWLGSKTASLISEDSVLAGWAMGGSTSRASTSSGFSKSNSTKDLSGMENNEKPDDIIDSTAHNKAELFEQVIDEFQPPKTTATTTSHVIGSIFDELAQKPQHDWPVHHPPPKQQNNNSNNNNNKKQAPTKVLAKATTPNTTPANEKEVIRGSNDPKNATTANSDPLGSIFAEIREQPHPPLRASPFNSTKKKKKNKKTKPPQADDQNSTTATATTTDTLQPPMEQQKAGWMDNGALVLPQNASNFVIPHNYSITAPVTSTVAWSNLTTMAFYEGGLRSGYRNQMMCFTILIMECIKQGHGQFLIESVPQKDTYGSNRMILFEKLWDVAHWNSFYPQLPRLVHHDPTLHMQFNITNRRWVRTQDDWFGTVGEFASWKPQRPFAHGFQHKLFTKYLMYGKGKGPYSTKDGHRNPAEIAMFQGAMRPHPDMRQIIHRLLQTISLHVKDDEDKNNNSSASLTSKNNVGEYMTLHARVEPDMQAHPVCREKKVLNLTSIFYFMETKWKDPPVARIFMPINRQYMEKEGVVNNPQKTNWIAVENLNALNRARDEGLWGGRVQIFEFGANALKNTTYESQPSTAGAMLNFFISIGAKIFVGTEVSSYSHDILSTRFFRGRMENYKYLPDGLHDWTPPGLIDPPGFKC